jgi:hypothetical protein
MERMHYLSVQPFRADSLQQLCHTWFSIVSGAEKRAKRLPPTVRLAQMQRLLIREL